MKKFDYICAILIPIIVIVYGLIEQSFWGGLTSSIFWIALIGIVNVFVSSFLLRKIEDAKIKKARIIINISIVVNLCVLPEAYFLAIMGTDGLGDDMYKAFLRTFMIIQGIPLLFLFWRIVLFWKIKRK